MSVFGGFIAQYQSQVVRYSKLYENYVALRKEKLALHEKVAQHQVEKDQLLAEVRQF